MHVLKEENIMLHGVLLVPKVRGDLHMDKGYWPINLLSVLSKVMDGIVKDNPDNILESGYNLSK